MFDACGRGIDEKKYMVEFFTDPSEHARAVNQRVIADPVRKRLFPNVVFSSPQGCVLKRKDGQAFPPLIVMETPHTLYYQAVAIGIDMLTAVQVGLCYGFSFSRFLMFAC